MAPSSQAIVAERVPGPAAPATPAAMTGDPWLDGVVWARGALKTRRTVGLQLGGLPYAACEAVRRRAEAAGCRTRYLERPRHRGGFVVLVLELEHDEARFAGLPRFRDRRIPDDAAMEFIAGAFHAMTEIEPAADLYGEAKQDAGTAVLRPWRPDGAMDDVARALERLGVRAPPVQRGAIRIPPDAYAGIELFESLARLAQQEEAEFLAASRGQRPWDQLSARILTAKGEAGTPHVVHAVLARRSVVSALLVALRRMGDDPEEPGAVALPCARNDDAVRGAYWDHLTLAPRSALRPGDDATLTLSAAVALIAHYDAVIARFFPLSREHAESMAIAAAVLAGRADHESSVRRAAAAKLLPEPRPRAELMRFFVNHVRPDWFVREPRGRVRLQPLDEILAGSPPAAQRRQVAARLAALLPTLLDEMDTISLHPDDLPAGEELLRHCTSCDGFIRLSRAAVCTECATAICLDCEEPGRARQRCAIHRVAPTTRRGRGGRTAGKRVAAARPAARSARAAVKELKVNIEKRHYLALHQRKVLTGMTLTEMVGDALEEYLDVTDPPVGAPRAGVAKQAR